LNKNLALIKSIIGKLDDKNPRTAFLPEYIVDCASAKKFIKAPSKIVTLSFSKTSCCLQKKADTTLVYKQ